MTRDEAIERAINCVEKAEDYAAKGLDVDRLLRVADAWLSLASIYLDNSLFWEDDEGEHHE